ncbi:UDP-glucuronic acid/UDP-N-acetylgalactosamine transporter [Fasciola gigantica]|uniref:UDP-glucuronic acid/UDP-N-acetylgalactosamine transporter n=1 Tax=Fasciola gigantica TaxID=46835 RepID=A0A504YK07_FASGI|nr:UDP-glucuronic acid/UDP-N-acetylgalactosamine transporter [Fasciola gigantica]
MFSLFDPKVEFFTASFGNPCFSLRCCFSPTTGHLTIMASSKAVFYSAVYMICSVGILFANKLVLTTYRFPSFVFLALAQTIFSFLLAHFFLSSRVREGEKLDFLVRVLPLSFCYAVDILMGIAGTGSLSLPMFSALRRLSNLFIMVGEKVILGVSRPFSVYMSVVVMVLGAIVAVIGDLTFDLLGYAYVFTNNFSTAAKALLTKSLLRDQGFSSLELLYYNSGLMVPALLIIVVLQTDLYQ